MSYTQQVIARMMSPGFVVMLLGALAVLLAGLLTRKLPQEKRENSKLLIKAVGTGVIALGAVIMFIIAP